jgi:RimJ/RimL family protein N-acetyltransferase
MKSNQNNLIKTKQQKIFLETLSLVHISSSYLDWMNDPVLTKYLEIGGAKLTKNDLEDYVLNSPKNGRKNYAIITGESKNHIGNCSIYDIDEQDKSYEIGWLIGDKNFSHGLYAPMAMFELHKIAFLDFGLERCRGKVIKENVKARLNNQFIGYKETANIKDYHKKTNKYLDVIKVELRKEDWLVRGEILSKKNPDFFQIT